MRNPTRIGSFAMLPLLIVLAAPGFAAAQGSAQPQVPQPAAGGVDWEGAGVGVATLVANVAYIPAKAVYAILGGITGGAGYALTGGNSQTADTIWRSALGGDYVLTPQMLSGRAPIHFSGPTTTPLGPAASAASPVIAPSSSAAAPSAPYSSAMNSGTASAMTSSNGSTVTSSNGMGSGSAMGSGMASSNLGSTRSSSAAMGGPSATAAPIGSTSITSEPADPGTGPVR